ncbi:hypothetical protein HY478_00660 [Candidatus Uhrbacteria bacterium]|nr:hypothetical protein [Candidatus Uhrbacteria bacterium]
MDHLYRIFFLLIACGTPDPEAVLVEFCAKHPEYRACETQSLEDQILEFCLTHPDLALCRTMAGDEPADQTSEEPGQRLVGGGTWDDKEGTLYRFETYDPFCVIRVGGGGGIRFEVIMGEDEPRAVLLMLLRGELRVGRIEQAAGEGGSVAIGLSVSIEDRSMATSPTPRAPRAVELSLLSGGWARGLFSASDLCATGVTTSDCTGQILGVFECAPSFFPEADTSIPEEATGG